MSDDDQQDDLDDGQEPLDPNIRKELREARAAKAKVRELEAQVAQHQRDAAFTAAGVPHDGMGQYFRKGYEGDLNPEAIKAAAVGAGVIQSPETDVQQVDLDKLAEMQRTAAPPTGGNPDQTEAFLEQLRALRGDKSMFRVNAPIGQNEFEQKVMDLLRHAPPDAGVQLFPD